MVTAKKPASRRATARGPKDDPEAVDAYLAALPPVPRRVLTRVRGLVRAALPDAVEGISYGMPRFAVNGSPAIYIAAWKEHWAVYPGSARVVAELGRELAGRVVSKGTLRFELDEPVPVRLIRRIVAVRVAEIAQRAPRTRRTQKANAKVAAVPASKATHVPTEASRIRRKSLSPKTLTRKSGTT